MAGKIMTVHFQVIDSHTTTRGKEESVFRVEPGLDAIRALIRANCVEFSIDNDWIFDTDNTVEIKITLKTPI
jgi:hypothetical protein